ncbi:MAG: DNA/RNA non-specific endonuclease [Ruminococcus sp.]|nr:DNA/RNA non-specific endonuclease [Ruminococcus sp.]
MRIRANVSLAEVTAIKEVAKELSCFDNRFNSGISCVEDLLQYLSQLGDIVMELSGKLQDSAVSLSEKKEKTENDIQKLRTELEQLHDELGYIKNQIANTAKTITIQISDEKAIAMPNPEYEYLQDVADSLRLKISEIEIEISMLQNKLDYIRMLNAQLNSYQNECKIDSAKIKEGISKCREIITNLTDLRNDNTKKSEEATGKLETICQIIEEYQSLKIVYDDSLAFDPLEKLGIEALINFGSMLISKMQNNTSSQKSSKDETRALDNDKPYREEVNPKTDDNGRSYRAGDNLNANNTFVRNGYQYTTDSRGRVVSASGTLNINEEGQANRRMSDSIEIIGKGHQKATDDRGHLIGHQFNGSDSLENLVPQNAKINQGNFKRLEDHLAKLVKSGYNVTANVVPIYSQQSHRPDAIFYFYTVNDNAFTVLFPNDITEE